MGEWWLDPPRSIEAGGRIISKASDDSVNEVQDENRFYYAGFDCVKEWGFPLDLISDHYESYYDQTYFKFQIPVLSGIVYSGATLYVMVAMIENIQVGDTTLISLKGHYRSTYASDKFPWALLAEDDQLDAGWTELGSFGTVAQIFTGYYTAGAPYWMAGLDVTSAVQDAIDNGWTWLGFKLQLTHKAPIGWDYDHRPTGIDQVLKIWLQGATTTFISNNLPTGHPASHDHVSPWLKISYSTLPEEEEQEEPGEEYTISGGSNPYTGVINCIAADVKAKSAIAGTTAGGLWYCWSGGGFWDKIYEVDSEVTAVYMDAVKNFMDYPTEEIAWFGTMSGGVYKSIDALASWNQVGSFSSKVVEIQGSELTSDKVVVGTELNGIYVTNDGGVSWQQVLAPS